MMQTEAALGVGSLPTQHHPQDTYTSTTANGQLPSLTATQHTHSHLPPTTTATTPPTSHAHPLTPTALHPQPQPTSQHLPADASTSNGSTPAVNTGGAFHPPSGFQPLNQLGQQHLQQPPPSYYTQQPPLQPAHHLGGTFQPRQLQSPKQPIAQHPSNSSLASIGSGPAAASPYTQHQHHRPVVKPEINKTSPSHHHTHTHTQAPQFTPSESDLCKPTKRGEKSIVWEVFRTVRPPGSTEEIKGWVWCTIPNCRGWVKRGGNGTSAMQNHLKHNHTDKFRELYPDNHSGSRTNLAAAASAAASDAMNHTSNSGMLDHPSAPASVRSDRDSDNQLDGISPSAGVYDQQQQQQPGAGPQQLYGQLSSSPNMMPYNNTPQLAYMNSMQQPFYGQAAGGQFQLTANGGQQQAFGATPLLHATALQRNSSSFNTFTTLDLYNNQFDAEHPRRLIPELCKQFYHLGWVTGTGGGISMRYRKAASPNTSNTNSNSTAITAPASINANESADPATDAVDEIYVAPSGVQKERMQPDDMYVLDIHQQELSAPPAVRNFKPSQCTPLFYNCYTLRNAEACIHTHSQHAVMATLLWGNEFTVTHQEMIKGIAKGTSNEYYSYYDTLIIPIIENTAHERDLQERMRQAMLRYPNTNCVLVRRHGCYVWSSHSWQKAKTQTECYDYLFEMACKMKLANIDPTHIPQNSEYLEIAHANLQAERQLIERASAELSGQLQMSDVANTEAMIKRQKMIHS